jgi:hypothetical protein
MFVARLFVGIRQEWGIIISVPADPLLERNSPEKLFYVPDRFFMYVTVSGWFSNKFCDLSLLHW